MSAWKGGTAVLLLLGFSACNSTPNPSGAGEADIVRGSFPEARAEIAATRVACTEAAMNRDWDALRAYHLESPKFSKITSEGARYDFAEMIADEIAGVSAMLDAMPDLKADLRDQKIDVFGDTAVETAFLVGTGTLPNGDRMEIEFGVSAVWVLTDAGWRIAHEHGTRANDIVEDPYFEAQAEIRGALLSLDDISDREGLLAVHVRGSKFSQVDVERGRTGFDEMLEEETAFVTYLREASIELEIDWRDLKVDVFGDVAVVTSLPRFIMTAEDGAVDGFDAAATLVWVRAADGWRIAHENINVIVDIIQDPFPEAQEAVRAAILSLEGIGRSRDWEALRAAHLEGPKFTDFGTGMRRHDFEQMLATEIAGISGMDDFSADFRDLKIDVFGNVAVATSFPIYTGTSANGEKIEIERRATMIYVETRDGWKIAHEHLSKPEPE